MVTQKSAKILCVDDESEILQSLKRLFRTSNFYIKFADSGQQALACLKEERFDLIISDMRMPGMDGASLLAAARECSPETKRILLTGYSDPKAITRAVNQGKIDYYIKKPWNNKDFKEKIIDVLKEKFDEDKKSSLNLSLKNSRNILIDQNRSLKEEISDANKNIEQTIAFLEDAHDELKQNFKTTIKIFLSLINKKMQMPHNFFTKIVSHSSALAKNLGLNHQQQSTITHSSSLYQLGKLTLPDHLILCQETKIKNEGMKVFETYPSIGADLLMPLDSMSSVAELVRHHQEHFDGTGYPDKLKGRCIPLGSRILKIVNDFNFFIADSGPGLCMTIGEAKSRMINRKNVIYDGLILEEFLSIVDSLMLDELISFEIVACIDLKAGMQVAEDVYNNGGMLLLGQDSVFTESMIKRLQTYERVNNQMISIKIVVSK